MSAALKIASVASGLTLFSYSAMHAMRTPSEDFSKKALAMDHTLDENAAAPAISKPKLYVRLLFRIANPGTELTLHV